MKRTLKIVLYVFIVLALVAASVYAGYHIPLRTKLEAKNFSSADERPEGVFPSDWDEETEMFYMESNEFPTGQDALWMTYNAAVEDQGLVIMLDSQWEEVSRAQLAFEQGRNEIEIEFPEDAVSFKLLTQGEETGFAGMGVIDSTGFNWKIACYMLILLNGLTLLILFWKAIKTRPEMGFLIAAICVMLVMFIWMPLNEDIVWDGGIHREKTERLVYIGADISLNEGLVNLSLNDVGYFPGSIGMRLGLLLTDDLNGSFLFTRIFNALTYIAACYFAIKMAARYKMIFAIAALIPTAMFLGNSCSYDYMVNGFVFLFLSLAISEILTPEKKISMGRMNVMMLSLFAACMTKAVYIPLVLILLFMPKVKFRSSKQALAFKATIVLVFLAIAATFVLPTLIGGTAEGDSRGGAVDPTAQLHSILTNPFGYAAFLLGDIFNTFMGKIYYMGNNFAYLGAGSGGTYWFITLLLCFTCLQDGYCADKRVAQLTWWRRLALFLCVFGAVVLINTSMFIAFTEPGSSTIAGVQARYFLSLVPATFIVLQPNFLLKKLDLRWANSLLLLGGMGINFYLIWQLLVMIK